MIVAIIFVTTPQERLSRGLNPTNCDSPAVKTRNNHYELSESPGPAPPAAAWRRLTQRLWETDANTVDMGSTVRVLYVDGSTRAPETVTALERETDRLAVEQVGDADEALAILAEFDCLVAAHDPPEQDGMTLLGRVRETRPDLPVVLFATDGDETLESDVIAAGPSEFVRRGGEESYVVLASRIERLVAQRATGDGGETGDREADEEYRQRLLAVVADPDATPDEKTGRLLELGCERFGTENGHLVKIDRDSGRHEVVSEFAAARGWTVSVTEGDAGGARFEIWTE